LALHRARKHQIEIVQLLKVPCYAVSKAIALYNELGHEDDRRGRGRKRTINTSRKRQLIKKWVNLNSRVSMRRIACETGIARESDHQMARTELNLKPYQLQKTQLLTNDNKLVWLQRSHTLLSRATGTHWEKIVFTDKKLFTVEQAHNH
jgi:ribosomal protein S14